MIKIEDLESGSISLVSALPDYCQEPSLIDRFLGTAEWRIRKEYITAPLSLIEKARGEPVNYCKFCMRNVYNKCIWKSQVKHCTE